MPAILVSWLNVLNTYSPSIQALAVIIGLFYGGRQIREIGKQSKLNRIVGLSLHLKDVNEIMTRNPQLAGTIGDSSEGAFLDIVLDTFEAWYLIRRAHLLSKRTWNAYLQAIEPVVTAPKMKAHWVNSVARSVYDPGFVEVVDTMLGIQQTPQKRWFTGRNPRSAAPPSVAGREIPKGNLET